MTGCEGHPIELGHVPCANDKTPAIRIGFDLVNDAIDLIDDRPIGAVPVDPLRSVDGAEVAVLVGPFIPNSDAVFVEITDVGLAAQKPEQFVDDRFQMQLLRGQRRKLFAQIEARLRAEH